MKTAWWDTWTDLLNQYIQTGFCYSLLNYYRQTKKIVFSKFLFQQSLKMIQRNILMILISITKI
jgi:hypothetical protein